LTLLDALKIGTSGTTQPRKPRADQFAPGSFAFMIQALVTLTHFYENTYFPAKLARKSHRTDKQMRLTIRRFEQFANRELLIDEVCDDMIDGFRIWRKKPDGKAVSAATLNKDLRQINALVNFACRRKKRSDQLDFDFEDELLDDPIAWFPEELDRIFAAAAAEEGLLFGSQIRAADFWPALVATIYSTGARITSILETPYENFDATRGILTIPARSQKHKKGQVHHLHERTTQLLRAIYLPARELLLPWPWDRTHDSWPTLNEHYRRILARAGLPIDRSRLFHCLRKTTGTRVAAASNAETARQQLGHSSTAVTARYIDSRQTPTMQAKQLIEPPKVNRIDQQRLLFE